MSEPLTASKYRAKIEEGGVLLSESDDTGAAAAKPPAPYTSFGTFNNFLQRLAKNPVPAVVDRGFIGGSGANQSQMQGALKFLGLIEADGTPTATLHELVRADDVDRPPLLAKLVRAHYAGATELGTNATQTQLEQWFRTQNVSGETSRKAQSFYLALAKAAGLDVSPHFKSVRATSTTPKKKVPRKPPADALRDSAGSAGASSNGAHKLHGSVLSLLDRIPQDGAAWTKADKDLLVQTFDNLLQLFYPPTS